MRCVDELDLRRDLQQIFIKTPKKKQARKGQLAGGEGARRMKMMMMMTMMRRRGRKRKDLYQDTDEETGFGSRLEPIWTTSLSSSRTDPDDDVVIVVFGARRS